VFRAKSKDQAPSKPEELKFEPDQATAQADAGNQWWQRNKIQISRATIQPLARETDTSEEETALPDNRHHDHGSQSSSLYLGRGAKSLIFSFKHCRLISRLI